MAINPDAIVHATCMPDAWSEKASEMGIFYAALPAALRVLPPHWARREWSAVKLSSAKLRVNISKAPAGAAVSGNDLRETGASNTKTFFAYCSRRMRSSSKSPDAHGGVQHRSWRFNNDCALRRASARCRRGPRRVRSKPFGKWRGGNKHGSHIGVTG
jgi:hypothetical protein